VESKPTIPWVQPLDEFAAVDEISTVSGLSPPMSESDSETPGEEDLIVSDAESDEDSLLSKGSNSGFWDGNAGELLAESGIEGMSKDGFVYDLEGEDTDASFCWIRGGLSSKTIMVGVLATLLTVTGITYQYSAKLRKKLAKLCSSPEPSDVEFDDVDGIKYTTADGKILVEARVPIQTRNGEKYRQQRVEYQQHADVSEGKKKGKTKGGWSMRGASARLMKGQGSNHKRRSHIYDDDSIEFEDGGQWRCVSGEEFRNRYGYITEIVLNGVDTDLWDDDGENYGELPNPYEAKKFKGEVPWTVVENGKVGKKPDLPKPRGDKHVTIVETANQIHESAQGKSMVQSGKFQSIGVFRDEGCKDFVGSAPIMVDKFVVCRHFMKPEGSDTWDQLYLSDGNRKWAIDKSMVTESKHHHELMYVSKSALAGCTKKSTKSGSVEASENLNQPVCTGIIVGRDGNGEEMTSPGDISRATEDDLKKGEAHHTCETERGTCGSFVVWCQDGSAVAVGIHQWGSPFGRNNAKSSVPTQPNGYIPFTKDILKEIGYGGSSLN
jgi:hypothetical protein